jgi:triosephosphate isomerase
VLYGGSVDSKNVQQFSQIKQIDGFLIGGASKSDQNFIDIIKNYYK